MDQDVRELMERIWSEWTDAPLTRADLEDRLPGVARKYYSPDVEFVPIDGWPGPETYLGHEGLMQFWTDWFSTFEDVTIDVEHIEVRGSITATMFVQTGHASGGMHVPWRQGVINVFKDGLVTRIEFYADEAATMRRLEELASAEPTDA